jgi:hypothetical protein
MKTLKFFGILCFILCFGVGASRATGIAKENANSRPFKATICYSYASWWTSGVGTATHLGLLTTQSSYTDIYDNEDNLTGTSGHDVFTAADGSQLIMDWSAVLHADFTEDGTFEFSGGTGRFEGASGSGSLHAFLTTSYDIVLIMTGTIVY